VTENLEPDWPSLEISIKNITPDIFVLTHYFGFQNDIESAVRFCKKSGASLLEDGAHVLRPFGNMGKFSWGAIYSPHKIFPVPMAGVLATNNTVETCSKMPPMDPDALKWAVRSMAKMFFINLNIPWKRQAASFKDDPFEVFKTPGSVSELALKILKISGSYASGIIDDRNINYRILMESISGGGQKLCPLFLKPVGEGCPYSFPIKVKDDKADDLYDVLLKNGIPAGTWPDLPPEVKSNPAGHQTAINLRKSVVVLPVHQNLKRSHVQHIAMVLKKYIRKEKNNG
jgi:dTDP-4-amino-4,6-dideoxygalactose transaminase